MPSRGHVHQSRETPEVTQSNLLRKTAELESQPSLSGDETRMIRREFTNTGHLEFYNSSGESKQQLVAGRGQNLDTKI